jgi:membrane protein implicated in regulation of membrane protease activity
MPGFDQDQVAIDNTIENRRLGSVLLTLGWILLWVGAMYGIFFFNSLRDGSWFWPISLAVVGVLGVILVVMGSRYRRALGATRLGTRDLAATLRQQKQDEDEEHNVA